MSHILGERTENQDGLELGRVRDLALDAQTGQALYVIIASGGTFGFGKRLSAVPAQNASTATTKVETLAVNLSEDGSPNSFFLTGRDLAAHLDSSARDRQAGKNSCEEPKTRAPLPTGRATEDSDGTQGDSRKLELASHLLGHRITIRSNEKIGKVIDLLIDFSTARPTYAIVSLPELFNRAGMFAIPLELLHCENGKLTTDADRKKLESAPPFDEKAWIAQKTSARQIYKVQNSPSVRGN